jgi:hypothetical protein
MSRGRTHRARRWIVMVVAIALIPAIWSYAGALGAPGNTPNTIRSVEWLKDHQMAWLVNDVERWWYSHHQPKKGGLPSGALGRTITGGTAPVPAQKGARRGHLPVPAAIAPVAGTPLPGEGQWRPLGQPVKGLPSMYAAFLRPDSVHTSLVTAVVWIDPTLVRAVGYAGVQEPGGGPWRNQAPIPPSVRPSLLAAFNSGFKMVDAHGGYYADGVTARPLRDGAATLVIRSDGTPTVALWGRDARLGPDVAFARQNLSLIVDNGQPVPDIAAGAKWGATLGNKLLVWRSGVGVTANGALVYAAGNGLSAASLADMLARAGAVRAMELDINSAWVDFFTYAPPSAGQPASAPTVSKLLPDMQPPLNDYLSASSRDFVAIFGRS